MLLLLFYFIFYFIGGRVGSGGRGEGRGWGVGWGEIDQFYLHTCTSKDQCHINVQESCVHLELLVCLIQEEEGRSVDSHTPNFNSSHPHPPRSIPGLSRDLK